MGRKAKSEAANIHLKHEARGVGLGEKPIPGPLT